MDKSLYAVTIYHKIMPVYENVDYEGLLMKMDQKSFVIDVREKDEVAETGSIPNSINIPRNVISFIMTIKFNQMFYLELEKRSYIYCFLIAERFL